MKIKFLLLALGVLLLNATQARTITEQEAQDAALSFLQQRHAGTTKAKADKVYNLQGQQQKSLHGHDAVNAPQVAIHDLTPQRIDVNAELRDRLELLRNDLKQLVAALQRVFKEEPRLAAMPDDVRGQGLQLDAIQQIAFPDDRQDVLVPSGLLAEERVFVNRHRILQRVFPLRQGLHRPPEPFPRLG